LTETRGNVEDDIALQNSGLPQWNWQILCDVTNSICCSSSGNAISLFHYPLFHESHHNDRILRISKLYGGSKLGYMPLVSGYFIQGRSVS